jgi:hypothetical protein
MNFKVFALLLTIIYVVNCESEVPQTRAQKVAEIIQRSQENVINQIAEEEAKPEAKNSHAAPPASNLKFLNL